MLALHRRMQAFLVMFWRPCSSLMFFANPCSKHLTASCTSEKQCSSRAQKCMQQQVRRLGSNRTVQQLGRWLQHVTTGATHGCL